MTIQSDIATATAAVVSGRVYQEGEVPERTAYPLVTFRRTLENPIMTLEGYSGITISEFTFECWGDETNSATAKALAITTAAALTAAIEAAQTTVLPSQWRLPVSGEDYDPATLQIMQPVAFGFAHP